MKTSTLWAFQAVSALVIGGAGVLKWMGNPTDQFVFATLDMEPFGRLLIGSIELLCAVALATNVLAAPGALLAIGTMLGAVIAHLTVLGAEVQGDGGLHLVLLSLVVATSSPVLFARRRQLPLIGSTL